MDANVHCVGPTAIHYTRIVVIDNFTPCPNLKVSIQIKDLKNFSPNPNFTENIALKTEMLRESL